MIHTFKAVGQPMLLDVGSGAVHAIDDMAFDVLEMWNDHTPEEIRDALKEKYTAQELDEVIGELKQLEELGALNAPDNYDDVKQVTEPGVVKSMCLHAAHDCNLRCKYCFAATGDFCMGERKLLPYEVGKAAIDWLVAHSGKRVNLELDFFGGEPLMNWQIVKDLVHREGKEQALQVHNDDELCADERRNHGLPEQGNEQRRHLHRRPPRSA